MKESLTKHFMAQSVWRMAMTANEKRTANKTYKTKIAEKSKRDMQIVCL